MTATECPGCGALLGQTHGPDCIYAQPVAPQTLQTLIADRLHEIVVRRIIGSGAGREMCQALEYLVRNTPPSTTSTRPNATEVIERPYAPTVVHMTLTREQYEALADMVSYDRETGDNMTREKIELAYLFGSWETSAHDLESEQELLGVTYPGPGLEDYT